MEWMVMPYRRYADFTGRSSRREYWMFVLFNVIVYALLLGVGFTDILRIAARGGFAPGQAPSLSGLPMLGIVAFVIAGVFALASFIPSIAVQVRRFHDQDKSGWFLLLGFIPYVGGLIVLVFMCIEGTRGPNRFGEDPRDPYAAEVFR